ncbi:secretin N-terminal domain-containing protein [Luteolibacter sp. Populi]|uniref:secretin N-terminal domain-containing protein n=1 Tax=Luteolibacter sp. Populi TaxID=3230487 RepID=UPI003467E233
MLLKPHFYLAGWLLAGAALAQEPVVPPVPGGAPNAPGANRPARPPEAGPMKPAPDPATIKQAGYIEPKIDGQGLAELYTEMTGRRVTVSNEAIAAEFRFVQRGPITYGEATRLLKEAALLGGFVFVPSGENHDRLMFSQSPGSVQGSPLPTITDPADLPEGEQVVTFVMPLKFIKPQEMERLFTAVVRQFGSYGSIASVPNASSVIITESSSLIRRLIDLQKEIDVPSQQVATRFIKVQYADVQELSETLNEILNAQQQSKPTAGTQRVQGGAAPPGGVPNPAPGANIAVNAAGGDGGGSAGEDIPIQIVPAPRTNEIFAMGRPIDIVFVETLVRGFDSPSDQKNFLRRKLKFLAVSDFLPVAEQALQRAFGGTSGGAAGGAGGATQGGGSARGANFGGGGGAGGNNSRTTGSSRTQANGSSSSGGSFGGGGSGGAGGGAGGGGAGGGGLGESQVSTAPVPLLVGRTLLVADNITNSIVIQGPPAGLEIITKLLDEIDVKAEQVMISCVFGQLSLGKDLNYGIDYLRTVETRGDNVIGGRGGSGAGGILPLDGTVFDPGDLVTTGGGLAAYGRIGPHMNIYLNALQASSKFNVISRPTIFIANNQNGTISSGQRIAVPTNSFNSGTTGQSTNIEYRDVVLKLEVRPLVNSADELTLQIYLLNDEVVGSQNVEGVGEVPTIATRELVTTVTVPNNDTIVLGGLITTRDNKRRSGIPILSTIPFIGGLFGTTETKGEREELLIFIQPKIINDSNTLYDAQVDIDARYKIDDDNRAFIDGPGVLPSKQGSVVDSKGKNGAGIFPVAKEVPEEPVAPDQPRAASARPKKSYIKNR